MFGVAIESQPIRMPKRLTHRAVLNAVIESYKARIEELERVNEALKASYEERGRVIKELTRAKD